MGDASHRFLAAVAGEWHSATAKYPPMNSVHEAYAVILEEVDEFWEECRKKQVDHNPTDMYNELTQIAAMAMRAATDLLDAEVWHG